MLDTRVVHCGDNLDQLAKLPDACVDLIYIDPPFNSNRNYEVVRGETKEKRSFEDRHASTAAYIDYMRPRCVQLARVLKKTGSFYYHCDWHAISGCGENFHHLRSRGTMSVMNELETSGRVPARGRKSKLPAVTSLRRAKVIPFGWYGGKYSHLDWLLPLLPKCHHYCEPYAGSGAVLLNRLPSPVETYNDLDGEVVNFFRVLRDEGDKLVRAISLTPFSREEFAIACKLDPIPLT